MTCFNSFACITSLMLEFSLKDPSFTSKGRINATYHFILSSSINEISRFEGVFPNISVKTITPFPLSTLEINSLTSSFILSNHHHNQYRQFQDRFCGPIIFFKRPSLSSIAKFP